ncbi:MAG: peptidoglycan DD-metalloendopeptidase family protein [Chitinophagaceae bacterium]|nr:peptidoglycan DD-metalloendopeptidase family protein [Chitinophagaceae bacterium]
MEETKKVKDEVLHKQEKEKLVLVDERKEKDEVVSKLKAREKEITKELTAKAKNDRLLRNSISVAVKREMDKARAAAAAADAAAKKADAAAPKAPVTTNATNPVAVKPTRAKSVLEATPEGAIISADFEKNKGKLPWPVENANVKIHFGLYSIEGQNVKGNNPGLTIETNEGGQVKAVFDGEVVYIFDVDGTTTVMVRHGKYFTTYGNLANVAVSKGQKVTVGQRIGKVTNNNDGNGELEFLIMQENHEVNPEAWLRRK